MRKTAIERLGWSELGWEGKQLFFKAFLTQVYCPLWTCTQKALKRRDTTDFLATATPTAPAHAGTASTMISCTGISKQRWSGKWTPHLTAAGETPRLLGLKM